MIKLRHRLLVASLAATFACASPAQKVEAGDHERRSSTVFVVGADSETLAAVAVGYGQATWRDGYDAQLASLRGNYTRLGAHWWTTLDTVAPIEIGGTRIPAGSYYLGVAIGDGGALSLLVFDSREAMKARIMPWTTALYRGDFPAQFRAPLALAKDVRKDVVAKLEIEVRADAKAPATGTFTIRWGRHEASAPMQFTLAVPQDAVVPKK